MISHPGRPRRAGCRGAIDGPACSAIPVLIFVTLFPSCRIEFGNVFNRTQFTNTQLTASGYTAPQSTNSNGTTSGGFGYFNRAVASNQLGQPRSGTIVARFTF